MTKIDTSSEAVERIEAYLAERKKMPRLDQEDIAGANLCHLTVSDLRALLAERDAQAKQIAELSAARDARELRLVEFAYQAGQDGVWCAHCGNDTYEPCNAADTLTTFNAQEKKS